MDKLKVPQLREIIKIYKEKNCPKGIHKLKKVDLIKEITRLALKTEKEEKKEKVVRVKDKKKEKPHIVKKSPNLEIIMKENNEEKIKIDQEIIVGSLQRMKVYVNMLKEKGAKEYYRNKKTYDEIKKENEKLLEEIEKEYGLNFEKKEIMSQERYDYFKNNYNMLVDLMKNMGNLSYGPIG
jgi:hypothetical protein